MDMQIEIAEARLNQEASEIVARIRALEVTDDGEPLRQEMNSLKVALKENPSACMLLLDEDVGILAKTIRRIVGIDRIEATTKKPKGRKPKEDDIFKKQLSAEELEAAWDDLA